jgi:hypothetical protein
MKCAISFNSPKYQRNYIPIIKYTTSSTIAYMKKLVVQCRRGFGIVVSRRKWASAFD